MFSFGIILWEVMARRQPFHHIGGPAYRIMWAVHSGKRPHLIQACPEVLDCLMRRCWEKDAVLRPSMSDVVTILATIRPLFSGSEERLRYPSNSSSEAMGLGYPADNDTEYGEPAPVLGDPLQRPAGIVYHQPLNMEPIAERTEEGAFLTDRRRSSAPASPGSSPGPPRQQRPDSLLPRPAASLEEDPYQVPLLPRPPGLVSGLPPAPYRVSPTTAGPYRGGPGGGVPHRPSPTSIPEEPAGPGYPAGPALQQQQQPPAAVPSPTAAALPGQLGGDQRNKRHSADLSQLDLGAGRPAAAAAAAAAATAAGVQLTHEQKKALGE